MRFVFLYCVGALNLLLGYAVATHLGLGQPIPRLFRRSASPVAAEPSSGEEAAT